MSVSFYTDACSTSPGAGIRIIRVTANWAPCSFMTIFIMIRMIRVTSMTSMTSMLHMMLMVVVLMLVIIVLTLVIVVLMVSTEPFPITVIRVGFVLACEGAAPVAKKLCT